jgi:hypothetical protein
MKYWIMDRLYIGKNMQYMYACMLSYIKMLNFMLKFHVFTGRRIETGRGKLGE